MYTAMRQYKTVKNGSSSNVRIFEWCLEIGTVNQCRKHLRMLKAPYKVPNVRHPCHRGHFTALLWVNDVFSNLRVPD